MKEILSVLPSVLLAFSSVCFLIVSFVQYLSCDSCKVKRQAKLAKLLSKIEEQKEKVNE